MDSKNREQNEKKIQLIKGVFTFSEASYVIMNLINEKIKFHKSQRLQIWERDHTCNTDQIDMRINELEKEKKNIQEFMDTIPDQELKLKINSTIEISVVQS